MDNWITATSLRRELTTVLAGLHDLEEPLVIIHRSIPIAVLWDYERFHRLMEKLEEAEDLLVIVNGAGEEIVAEVMHDIA